MICHKVTKTQRISHKDVKTLSTLAQTLRLTAFFLKGMFVVIILNRKVLCKSVILEY